MAYPLEGPMPMIDLVGGCQIVLRAVDPTDGSTVAGVEFSDGVAYVDSQGPVGPDAASTLAVWLQPSSSLG